MQVNIKQLLEAGVHFGHQTQRWNPKMKKYIFGARNGIYIINLEITLLCLERALEFLKKCASEGKEILLVGTKRQAQEPIREGAGRCAMPYVDQRWLGGMLTNFETIRKSVARLESIEKMEQEGGFSFVTKKEAAGFKKEREKLLKNLGGVRNMKKLPGAIFVIDSKKEEIALHEAAKLGIPIVAVLDTNCDPDLVDYPIPGNDDAIRAVKLFCDLVAQTIQEGRNQYLQQNAVQQVPVPPVSETLEKEKTDSEEASREAPQESFSEIPTLADPPLPLVEKTEPEEAIEEKLAARFAVEKTETEKKAKKVSRKDTGKTRIK